MVKKKKKEKVKMCWEVMFMSVSFKLQVYIPAVGCEIDVGGQDNIFHF